MKLPTLKRLAISDVKDAPRWMDSVMFTLNNFFQYLFSALDHNLSFQDNISCQIVEVKRAAPFEDFKVVSKLAKPIGVLLLGVSGVGATSPVLSWRQDRDNLLISVSGLTDGNEYNLRILVI